MQHLNNEVITCFILAKELLYSMFIMEYIHSNKVDLILSHGYYNNDQACDKKHTHLCLQRNRGRHLWSTKLNTVVPVLGDPCRERPPAVYGHVINAPTYLNVILPAIGGHLPNADADSHSLVVRTCYNGQCKQMPLVRWSFQPKTARGADPKL